MLAAQAAMYVRIQKTWMLCAVKCPAITVPIGPSWGSSIEMVPWQST